MKTRIKIASNAWLYLRVSTEEQARDAYGLESQEKECREFCRQRGWNVTRVFSDRGISGWADVERPQFKAMMAEFRKERNANLVIFDYSRFGRKTLPALGAFDELDRLGIFSIATTNPGIDCRTAAGRTARRDELSKAEDFSDQNSEKTVSRMKAAFEDGRWSRQAPFGYRNVGTKAKGQPNIVPLEPESTLVRKSFELMHTGNYRPAEVLRIVTGMGLRSKKGNKLTAHSFLTLLRNPVYIGLMQSKKWRATSRGIHEPIVDERVFRNVQLILKGKKPVLAPYQRNREGFPLRRFLRCSACSSPLTGGMSRSATGKQYPYYNCFRCRKVKSLAAEKASDEFAAMLRRLRPTPLMMADFPSIMKEEWGKTSGDNDALLRRLKVDLREKNALHEKLVTAYLANDRAIVPVFEHMSQKFRDDIESLESQISEAQERKATFEELLAFSKALLVDVSTAWERADLDQKQRVQNALFPKGLSYDPQNGISNTDNDSLFSQLEGFV
jgi:DNA invertase Pin-like site-specific DNA recombinase